MTRLVQWERQIGRRVRLRDLFVFFTVVEYGSMAKAGAKLGVSTPSVSEVIADLEQALGVRLLDRSPKGVGMTPYGEALLARGRAAFDELRQGVRDIEFIADPEAGELRIGCPESIAAGFLIHVLERFSREHPRVKFHVVPVFQPTVEFPELLERKIDLVLARLANDPVRGRLTEQLNAEVLFRDRYALVVGENSKWARPRRVTLADLVDEPWIMTPLDALGDSFLANAFKARGLTPPALVIVLNSSAQQSRRRWEIHHRVAGLSVARLPQALCAQRTSDRIVDTAPGSGGDAEKQDARSNRATVPPMCPRTRCEEWLVGKLGSLHRSCSATSAPGPQPL